MFDVLGKLLPDFLGGKRQSFRNTNAQLVAKHRNAVGVQVLRTFGGQVSLLTYVGPHDPSCFRSIMPWNCLSTEIAIGWIPS